MNVETCCEEREKLLQLYKRDMNVDYFNHSHFARCPPGVSRSAPRDFYTAAFCVTERCETIRQQLEKLTFSFAIFSEKLKIFQCHQRQFASGIAVVRRF
jgi:hypothetical protein